MNIDMLREQEVIFCFKVSAPKLMKKNPSVM